MDERLYWVWLARAVGPAFAKAGELLQTFGSARGVYEARRGSGLAATLSPARAARLMDFDPAQCEPVLEACARLGVTVLTPDSPDYPANLRTLPDLPLALYATGDVRCLNGGRYVGMVGTRRPTAYGRRACHDISLELAQKGFTIVSGLADGLDGEGHKAAVEAGAPTVAFLGTPIDRTYPAVNRPLRQAIEQQVGGAVVSEFAPGEAGEQKNSFLMRNRLIAGMGEALCVAEARTRSGTMNTVHHARDYGRPVLAVPGSIYSTVSEGVNELLATGQAHVLRSAGDVLALLGCAAPPKKRAAGKPAAEKPAFELTQPARQVLAALDGAPRTVSELCADTGMPAHRVQAALTLLELNGMAGPAAGHRYALL
ncbi:MAG: DNA-processing protein DprA [Gemmiger sp.]